MNVNEDRAMSLAGKRLLHPNDDVICLSSNDTFPTAIHIAALIEISDKYCLHNRLILAFKKLEEDTGIVNQAEHICRMPLR